MVISEIGLDPFWIICYDPFWIIDALGRILWTKSCLDGRKTIIDNISSAARTPGSSWVRTKPPCIRLWREKRGEAEPEDLSGNLIVQLGCVTEDLNRHWYERNTGQVVTDVQKRVRHPLIR